MCLASTVPLRLPLSYSCTWDHIMYMLAQRGDLKICLIRCHRTKYMDTWRREEGRYFRYGVLRTYLLTKGTRKIPTKRGELFPAVNPRPRLSFFFLSFSPMRPSEPTKHLWFTGTAADQGGPGTSLRRYCTPTARARASQVNHLPAGKR